MSAQTKKILGWVIFIGVIVDAMQSEHEAEAHNEREQMRNETEQILLEVRALRAELAELREKSA